MSEVFVSINVAGSYHFEDAELSEDYSVEDAEEELKKLLQKELAFDNEEWFTVEVSIDA